MTENDSFRRWLAFERNRIQIERLMLLEDNWDWYGWDKISSMTEYITSWIVEWFSYDNWDFVRNPWVGPLPDGIQIDCNTDRFEYEIEIRDKDVHFLRFDKDNHFLEDESYTIKDMASEIQSQLFTFLI